MATRDKTREFTDYRNTAKVIGRGSLSPLHTYGGLNPSHKNSQGYEGLRSSSEDYYKNLELQKKGLLLNDDLSYGVDGYSYKHMNSASALMGTYDEEDDYGYDSDEGHSKFDLGDRRKKNGMKRNRFDARLSLPPLWIDTVDKIDDHIENIKKKMKILDEHHRNRLKAIFNDEQSNEMKIDSLTAEITGMFRTSETLLKKLPQSPEDLYKQDEDEDDGYGEMDDENFMTEEEIKELDMEEHQYHAKYKHKMESKDTRKRRIETWRRRRAKRKKKIKTNADFVVTKNIQKSLAKKLQEASLEFRSSQREYMHTLKAQKENGGLGVGGQNGLNNILSELVEESERDLKKVSLMSSAGGGFTEEQLLELEIEEAIVNERDQEITHIAQNIEELSQIFKELAVLVIDQGTLLDRIDYNMEQVVERTSQGVTQLMKAEENQKSSTSFRCIVILLVLIFLMLLILIFKHSR